MCQQPIYENSLICLQFLCWLLVPDALFHFDWQYWMSVNCVQKHLTERGPAALHFQITVCAFAGQMFLRFWECVCHLNCWNISVASCWEFCKGFV